VAAYTPGARNSAGECLRHLLQEDATMDKLAWLLGVSVFATGGIEAETQDPKSESASHDGYVLQFFSISVEGQTVHVSGTIGDAEDAKRMVEVVLKKRKDIQKIQLELNVDRQFAGRSKMQYLGTLNWLDQFNNTPLGPENANRWRIGPALSPLSGSFDPFRISGLHRCDNHQYGHEGPDQHHPTTKDDADPGVDGASRLRMQRAVLQSHDAEDDAGDSRSDADARHQ
jgi:hypothetical protein